MASAPGYPPPAPGNAGCSWLRLAAPGSSWLLLAAPASSWQLLAAPGSSWLHHRAQRVPQALPLATVSRVVHTLSIGVDRALGSLVPQKLATLTTTFVVSSERLAHWYTRRWRRPCNCKNPRRGILWVRAQAEAPSRARAYPERSARVLVRARSAPAKNSKAPL